MSTAAPQVTRPEDRVHPFQMFIYGLGGMTNNLLSGAYGGLMIVLILGLEMNPILVGVIGMVPRLFDAFTDPVVGYISDNTRTRFGRRRPFIFVGAILVGLMFMAIWQFPAGKSEMFYFWYFLIGSMIFFLVYTIFITPWVALGYELTPDYNERSRLMGAQNFIAQTAYLFTPWLLAIVTLDQFGGDIVLGTSVAAIWIGAFAIVVGVLPAIFLKERIDLDVLDEASGEEKPTLVETMADFLSGFGITLSRVPFLKLCGATLLVFNSFILIAAFQAFVIIHYLYGGSTEAATTLLGVLGTITTVSTYVVIIFVTFLSTVIGKRKAFAVAMVLYIIGCVIKYFSYNPDMPYLLVISTPFLAFGLGALFTLMPSMIADVVDLDELETHERREGMYGSIFWWVVKLGLSLAGLGSGLLLTATGFNEAKDAVQTPQTLELLRFYDAFVPIVATLIAIWAVMTFEVTQERARDIRKQLEARRGRLDHAPAD